MSELTSARLEIIETLNRYAWGYDTGDLELMGGCFDADGSFAITLAGHEGWGPYRGRQAIVDWLASVMEGQADQRRHCVTNIVFRALDGERARVDSYLLLTAVEEGQLRMVCTGTYHDDMVCRDGAWLIGCKTLRLDNPF
ncbi:MAG: nuclear transport factor 2 family protein [Gammaproteobacteria bacterium]